MRATTDPRRLGNFGVEPAEIRCIGKNSQRARNDFWWRFWNLRTVAPKKWPSRPFAALRAGLTPSLGGEFRFPSRRGHVSKIIRSAGAEESAKSARHAHRATRLRLA